MENRLVLPPTALSLITTYKCNAACVDCCFACNPKRTEKLSLSELKNYVDIVTSSYPTIQIIILTGGECFLLKKDLVEAVRYIKSRDLFVRIVTNGFWAKNYSIAIDKLTPLVKAGLNEINFSTGDDHIEFVPVDRIKYGAIASLELGLTTLINVESGKDRKFKSKMLEQDKDLQKHLFPNKTENPLGIINGLWMPFSNNSTEQPDKIAKHIGNPYNINRGKCTNLFNTITITPKHRMVACCGLPSNSIKYLDLGNLKTESIKNLYEIQFNDFIKIWLFTDGPYQILKFISTKIGEKNVKELSLNRHICFYCARLLTNEHYMHTIRKYFDFVYSSIILKYIFSTKKTF